jgi:hypothetical protein
MAFKLLSLEMIRNQMGHTAVVNGFQTFIFRDDSQPSIGSRNDSHPCFVVNGFQTFIFRDDSQHFHECAII